MKNTIQNVIIAVILGAALPAFADEKTEKPEECSQAFKGEASWAECAAAAKVNSGPYLLAHMNLGTNAYLERNFEEAAKHYDLSAPEGQTTYSDIFLHTYRADTFLRVGRRNDAQKDAKYVIQYLKAGRISFQSDAPLSTAASKQIYSVLINVLFKLEMPEADESLNAYKLFPIKDWIDTVNRTAVLIDAKRYDDALTFSVAALALKPDHPGVLNNHCYLLGLMGRGDDAIPYCEKAILMEPHDAGLFDSYSVALAAAGRCDDSASAMAKAQELSPSIVDYQSAPPCSSEKEIE